MHTDDMPFPRIAIRCKNPQCRDRGRVLAETNGAQLWIVGGGYIAVSVPVCCPTCASVQKWIPICYTVRQEVAA